MKIYVPVKHGIAKFDYIDYISIKKEFSSFHSFSGKRGGAYLVGYKGNYSKQVIHRFIMKTQDNMVVDHINHDGLDNTRANLRNCTVSENNRNVRPRLVSSSQYRGVSYNPANKNWRARVYYNKKTYEVGSFENEYEAAIAYNEKAKELFGNYANLNILHGGINWL